MCPDAAVEPVRRGGALDMNADYASLLMDAIYGRPQGGNFVRDIEQSLRTLGSNRQQIRDLGTLDASRPSDGSVRMRFTPNKHTLASVASSIQHAAALAEGYAQKCLLPKPPRDLTPLRDRSRERGMDR